MTCWRRTNARNFSWLQNKYSCFSEVYSILSLKKYRQNTVNFQKDVLQQILGKNTEFYRILIIYFFAPSSFLSVWVRCSQKLHFDFQWSEAVETVECCAFHPSFRSFQGCAILINMTTIKCRPCLYYSIEKENEKRRLTRKAIGKVIFTLRLSMRGCASFNHHLAN